jgi:hypothetical protein
MFETLHIIIQECMSFETKHSQTIIRNHGTASINGKAIWTQRRHVATIIGDYKGGQAPVEALR